MLTHVVIWKYRSDVEQEVREEQVRLPGSLSSIIKELERLAVGFDVLGLPRSFDTSLVATLRIEQVSTPILFIPSTSKLRRSEKQSARTSLPLILTPTPAGLSRRGPRRVDSLL